MHFYPKGICLCDLGSFFFFFATSKVLTHHGTGSRSRRSEVITSRVGKHPRLQQTRCLGYSLVLMSDERGSGIYILQHNHSPGCSLMGSCKKVPKFPICEEEHSYYCHLLLHWRPHRQTPWSEPAYLTQCVY